MIKKNFTKYLFIVFLSGLLAISCGKSAQELKNAADTAELVSTFDSYKESYQKFRNFKLPQELEKLPRVKTITEPAEVFSQLLLSAGKSIGDSTRMMQAITKGNKLITLLQQDVVRISSIDMRLNKIPLVSNKMVALIDPIIKGAEWKYTSDTIKYATEILSTLKEFKKVKYAAIDHVEAKMEATVQRPTFENGVSIGRVFLVDVNSGKLIGTKTISSMGTSQQLDSGDDEQVLRHLQNNAKDAYQQELDRLLYKETFVEVAEQNNEKE
ncbi:hypothetical protein N9B82_02100 [Saprospiraceae bacterium]|nr:hypothetical protein [Saprospiraceae bacterium]